MCAGLLIGLALQFLVVLTADNPHQVAVSFGGLRGWVDAVPMALTTVWLGLSFGPAPIFDIFTIPVQTATGWLVVALILAGGVWLILQRSRVRSAVGSMLLVGLTAGAIPTVTGWVSNRYLIILVLLWIAAGLITLGSVGWIHPVRVWAITVAVVTFAW